MKLGPIFISAGRSAAVCVLLLAGCDEEKEPQKKVQKKVEVAPVELGAGLEPLLGAWGMLGLASADKPPTSVANFVKAKKACETPYRPPVSSKEGGIELAKPPEAMRRGTIMHYPVGDHFQRSVALTSGHARRIDRIERLAPGADDDGWISFNLHKRNQTFLVRVRAMRIIAKPVIVLEEEGALLMRCQDE